MHPGSDTHWCWRQAEPSDRHGDNAKATPPRGSMSIHGPGRTGVGPDSRPQWFFVVFGPGFVLLWAGGGGGGYGAVSGDDCGRPSRRGEQPPKAKPQAASTHWGTTAAPNQGGVGRFGALWAHSPAVAMALEAHQSGSVTHVFKGREELSTPQATSGRSKRRACSAAASCAWMTPCMFPMRPCTEIHKKGRDLRGGLRGG